MIPRLSGVCLSWFVVADRLKRPVRLLKQEITYSELHGWLRYVAQTEADRKTRTDQDPMMWQLARICYYLYLVNSDPKKPRLDQNEFEKAVLVKFTTNGVPAEGSHERRSGRRKRKDGAASSEQKKRKARLLEQAERNAKYLGMTFGIPEMMPHEEVT